MKRKRLLLFLGCLASVLVGYGTLRLTAPRHRINDENFEAIKKGMTEKEVEEILGGPAGIYAFGAITGRYSWWFIPGEKTPGMAIIPSGPFREGKEWIAKDMSIYVFFDEDGRVGEKLRGSTHFGKDSFLIKLRRWLRM